MHGQGAMVVDDGGGGDDNDDDEGKRGNQIKGTLPRWGGFWEDESGGSRVPAAAAGPSLDSSGSDLFLN